MQVRARMLYEPFTARVVPARTFLCRERAHNLCDARLHETIPSSTGLSRRTPTAHAYFESGGLEIPADTA
eukprot:2379923-Prymnesium_polylepis.1